MDKAAKFLVEKLSTSEVISQKPHGGGGGKHPPSAFRVKIVSYFALINQSINNLFTSNQGLTITIN